MLFIDSSDPKEIEEAFGWGAVRGVTTNPLIMARQGVTDIERRMDEIMSVSTGPVSVELTEETESGMLRQAREWRGRASDSRARLFVKVPFSEVGLRVTRILSKEGAPVNVTCIMNFNQTVLANNAGATLASVFVGRIDDMGYDGCQVIRDIIAVRAFRRAAPSMSPYRGVIAASLRSAKDVQNALLAGADYATVPMKILRSMLWNPRTESTIREFNEAWANRPGSNDPGA